MQAFLDSTWLYAGVPTTERFGWGLQPLRQFDATRSRRDEVGEYDVELFRVAKRPRYLFQTVWRTRKPS